MTILINRSIIETMIMNCTVTQLQALFSQQLLNLTRYGFRHVLTNNEDNKYEDIIQKICWFKIVADQAYINTKVRLGLACYSLDFKVS